MGKQKIDWSKIENGRWNIGEIYRNEDEAIDSLVFIEKVELPKRKNKKNSKEQRCRNCKETLAKLRKVYLYFQLSYLVNIERKNYLDMLDRIQSLYNDIFVEIYISEECESLEKHNAREEKIMEMIESNEEEFFDKYNNLLNRSQVTIFVDNREVELTLQMCNDIFMHKEREVRKRVYNEFSKKVLMNARKDMAYIFSAHLYNQNIINIFENSTENFSERLALSDSAYSIYCQLRKNINEYIKYFQIYLKEKADFMEIDNLYSYDIDFEVFSEAEKIDYLNGIKCIIKMSKKYGEEYSNVIIKALNEQWIDVFESENKTRGAFCCNVEGFHPYILVNYNQTGEELLVLSHELGHGVQIYLSGENIHKQNHEDFLLAEEIPAILNELFVLDELCKNSSNRTKIIGLKRLERILQGIINVMMELEFIQLVANAERYFLSEDTLNEIWEKLNLKYYGKRLGKTEFLKYEWMKMNWFQSNEEKISYLLGYVVSFNLYSRKFIDKNKFANFLKANNISCIEMLLMEINIDLEKGDYINENLRAIQNCILEMRK